MIISFIKIRIKQFYREFKGIGILRIIFLAGLVFFLGFVLFKFSETIPNVYYTTGVYTFIILQIQLKRNDKFFLACHFNQPRIIYLVEYLFLSSPLLICLVFHSQWTSLLVFLPVMAVITLFDFKSRQRSLNTKLQQWIPADSFEWKAGIRKSLFFVVPLWIAGMGTSFYIGSVPVVIFIFGIFTLGFYEKGEPHQMLLAFEMGTNRFLFHKIKRQITLFSAIVFPLIIAFIIFHAEKWYITAGEYLVFTSIHIYLIVVKYAFYEPNRKSPAAQTFEAIGAMGTIIPFFIPAVWLLTARFYYKSVDNLNIYLDDYN